MTKKKITTKQLEKYIAAWDKYIPKCIDFRDSLITYKTQLAEGTTPSTPPPKNPPGVPGHP